MLLFLYILSIFTTKYSSPYGPVNTAVINNVYITSVLFSDSQVFGFRDSARQRGERTER